MSKLSTSAQEKLALLERAVNAEIREAKNRTEELHKSMSSKDMEKNGLLVRKVNVADESGALFGRMKVRFEEDPNRPGHLERFHARPGTIVRLREENEEGQLVDGAAGVVANRSPRQMVVVFDDPSIRLSRQADLIRTEDEITLRKMADAIQQSLSLEGRRADLLEVMLSIKAPSATEPGVLSPIDTKLHHDQVHAVTHGVFAPEVGLIHGPPGTGKSRVLVEIVRQCLAKGERILCLCASNAAIDHLALSLLGQDPTIKLARAGHPARVNELLEEHTLAGLTDKHERRQLARSYLDEAFRILQTARKRSARGKDAWRQEREARVEAGRLFADARRLERQAVDEVLRTTRVLCGTLLGFLRDLPLSEEFDVLVVDEASQVFSPALLPGLFQAKRIVLAGDHRQLPPTLLAKENLNSEMVPSAFHELMQRSDRDSFSHMLTVQHRMNEAIMTFPSRSFYDERLVAHETVKTEDLRSFCPHENSLLLPSKPLDLVDTAGAGFDERQKDVSQSYENEGEAGVILKVLQEFEETTLDPSQIGVITPYAAQVALLTAHLQIWVDQGLEIDSVDGFQGREKEAIIFSAVRSNIDGQIGFLSDARRLNVAITRAKKKLIVVGDSATLSHDPLWNRFFEFAMENSAYRSVFELPQEL